MGSIWSSPMRRSQPFASFARSRNNRASLPQLSAYIRQDDRNSLSRKNLHVVRGIPIRQEKTVSLDKITDMAMFQVIDDGRPMAYTADEGELLLEVATGQRGGMSPPMTNELDPKQYVALMGGTGPPGGRGFGGRGRGNTEPTAPPAFAPPESGNPTLMVFTLP